MKPKKKSIFVLFYVDNEDNTKDSLFSCSESSFGTKEIEDKLRSNDFINTYIDEDYEDSIQLLSQGLPVEDGCYELFWEEIDFIS